MEQILATLNGPADYSGFAALYHPEGSPENFTLESVQIHPIYRTKDGEETRHAGWGVRPDGQVAYHALYPEQPRRSLPISEGATMHLVYDSPNPLPGLTAWFLGHAPAPEGPSLTLADFLEDTHDDPRRNMP